jgi:hypothetical protein
MVFLLTLSKSFQDGNRQSMSIFVSFPNQTVAC